MTKVSYRVPSRLVKALFVLGLLLALVLVIEGLYQVLDSRPLTSFAKEMAAGDTSGTLEMVLDQEGISGQRTIPEGFDEEVFVSEKKQEFACDPDSQVVGFWDDSSVLETASEMRAELEAKDWCYVPSGDTTIESWTKQQGTYTWLLIQYATLGGGTSVVVNYR